MCLAAMVCLALSPLSALAQRPSGIQIVVSKEASPVLDLYHPGGLQFVGAALNKGLGDVVIQSVRGPGVFAGSTTTFQCTLEQWEPTRSAWAIEPPPIHEDSRVYSTPLTLRPNEQVRACWRSFQPNPGAGRARFRFRLWSTFARTGQSWTSEVFETTLRPIR